MGFPRQEYWSGLSFPSPGDLPHSGIKPCSPAFQADSFLSEPPGKLRHIYRRSLLSCVANHRRELLKSTKAPPAPGTRLRTHVPPRPWGLCSSCGVTSEQLSKGVWGHKQLGWSSQETPALSPESGENCYSLSVLKDKVMLDGNINQKIQIIFFFFTRKSTELWPAHHVST